MQYIKVCEYCGKEFKTNIENKKYCCQYHANKARHQRQMEKKDKINNLVDLKIKGNQEFMGIEIPVIEGGFGEGKRCLTDKTIAEIHGMRDTDIRRRINDNIKRFKNKIDFIDLKSCAYDAQQFKNIGYTNMQISKAKHIYLLSERGYAKLIKIMDTDLAWEIHDKLIDEYFTIRKILKENNITYEENLVLKVYHGGVEAIDAHKELSAIEVNKARKEEQEKAKKEKELQELRHKQKILEERMSRNHKISLGQVIEMLGIEGLTTTIFCEWLANVKGLGTYEKPLGEKKRVFQPNEKFIKWVSLEGYTFTGKTKKGNKISIAYSTEFVRRIQEHHINSLVNYVKFKKDIA